MREAFVTSSDMQETGLGGNVHVSEFDVPEANGDTRRGARSSSSKAKARAEELGRMLKVGLA